MSDIKCQVVILPTKGKGCISINRNNKMFKDSYSDTTNYHLYITSDEIIKVNDWIIINNKHLRQCVKIESDKYIVVGVNNGILKEVCKRL